MDIIHKGNDLKAAEYTPQRRRFELNSDVLRSIEFSTQTINAGYAIFMTNQLQYVACRIRR